MDRGERVEKVEKVGHSYRFQLVRMTAERICKRMDRRADHSILMRLLPTPG